MWWQGLDQEAIRPRRHKEGDPICPLPGTSPESRWGTEALLQSARENPAPSGEKPRPSGRAGSRNKSGGGGAAGGKAGPGDGRRFRPSSAPALLRGDPPLLLLGSRPVSALATPQERELGDFRQGLEDKEVRRKLSSLRREGRIMKDAIDGVDVMSDPCLFDLKVSHNAAQRAKSAAVLAARRPPLSRDARHRRSGKDGHATAPGEKESAAQAKQLREMADALDRDTKGTCNRIGLSHKFVKDPRLQRIAIQMRAKIGYFTIAQSNVEESAAKAVQHKEITGFKSLFAKTADALQQDKDSMLAFGSFQEKGSRSKDAKLLSRITEGIWRMGISMRSVLEAMDSDGNGRVREEDWKAGLEILGYTAGDAIHAWSLLDPEERHEGMAVADLESRLTHLASDGDVVPSNPRHSVRRSTAFASAHKHNWQDPGGASGMCAKNLRRSSNL